MVFMVANFWDPWSKAIWTDNSDIIYIVEDFLRVKHFDNLGVQDYFINKIVQNILREGKAPKMPKLVYIIFN